MEGKQKINIIHITKKTKKGTFNNQIRFAFLYIIVPDCSVLLSLFCVIIATLLPHVETSSSLVSFRFATRHKKSISGEGNKLKTDVPCLLITGLVQEFIKLSDAASAAGTCTCISATWATSFSENIHQFALIKTGSRACYIGLDYTRFSLL